MRRIRAVRLASVPVLLTLLAVVACKDKTPPPPAVVAPPAPPPFDPPAPDSFRVSLETSKGTIVVELLRAWSPRGVDRFNHLVKEGYFTDVRFFRVVPKFVAQFGMHGDTAMNNKWKDLSFPDDPVTQSNKRGTIVFATRGPNTRSNQFFINLGDNAGLDGQGFSPIGRVVEGMSVVDALYGAYGDGPPGGTGPDQARIGMEGNAYLMKAFPKLDFIKRAAVVGAVAGAK